MEYYDSAVPLRRARRRALWAALLYGAVVTALLVGVSFGLRSTATPPPQEVIVELSSPAAASTTSIPAVVEDPVEESGDVEVPAPVAAKPKPVEKPTVNPRALFPGRQTTSQEGTGEGAAETGTGSGIEYSLDGRSIRGAWPKPAYPGQGQGRVVIDVTVDAAGRVTWAGFRPKGSTTTARELVDAAVAAARRAQFNPSETLNQSGTIVYTFTLK